MNKNRPILIFLVARAMLYLSLPYEGLVGYGDLVHFFGTAQLEGWPFFNYWMEYPPLFPFLAEVLYWISGGTEHVFLYLLVGLLTIVQAANIYLFMRIARIIGPVGLEQRVWTYLAILIGLFYGWGNVDALSVFGLLLGIWWMVSAKPVHASLTFTIGALVKWFPLLGLPALLRRPSKKLSHILLASVGLLVVVWGTLALVTPEFTAATFQSQSAKGSWETVWALLDGNLTTGIFGARAERYDPSAAGIAQGNPARISPMLTLIPFALIGGWVFLKSQLETPRSKVAFIAFTFCIFFLWSPGWSPQWVLYLLPLMLLLLRGRIVTLMSAAFVAVNLLEWPLLLSRGLFWSLYITIPIRTFLVLLLAWEFWLMIPKGNLELVPMESS